MCSFGFTALEVAFMVNRLCCLGSEVRQYILMQVHVWEINSFQGGWDSVRRRKDLGVLELHQRDTLTPLMKVSIIFILIGSSIYQYNWLWNSLYQMGCGRYLSKPLSGYSEIWAIFKNKSSGQSNNQHLVFLGGSLMHRTSFPAVHIQTEVVWWLIIFSECILYVYISVHVCVCMYEWRWIHAATHTWRVEDVSPSIFHGTGSLFWFHAVYNRLLVPWACADYAVSIRWIVGNTSISRLIVSASGITDT